MADCLTEQQRKQRKFSSPLTRVPSFSTANIRNGVGRVDAPFEAATQDDGQHRMLKRSEGQEDGFGTLEVGGFRMRKPFSASRPPLAPKKSEAIPRTNFSVEIKVERLPVPQVLLESSYSSQVCTLPGLIVDLAAQVHGAAKPLAWKELQPLLLPSAMLSFRRSVLPEPIPVSEQLERPKSSEELVLSVLEAVADRDYAVPAVPTVQGRASVDVVEDLQEADAIVSEPLSHIQKTAESESRRSSRPQTAIADDPNGSLSEAAAAYKSQAQDFSAMKGNKSRQLQEVSACIQSCYDSQMLEFRSMLGSKGKQLAEVARCLEGFDSGLGMLKHLLL